jgi:hypothetical protein
MWAEGIGHLKISKDPTECGQSECDRTALTIMRPWPTRGCCAMKKNSSRCVNE